MPDDEAATNRDNVPVPDPTRITMERLDATAATLRREIAYGREIIETRLSGNDEATRLRLGEIDKIWPGEVERLVGHLKEIHVTDIRNILDRFAANDAATRLAADTSQKALDAALLQAAALVRQQNEANDRAATKVEASFSKLIDQLGVQIQTEGKARDARVDEIKERVVALESQRTGGRANRDEHRQDNTLIIGALGVILFIISVGISIAVAFKH
jgi:polyhydroxyalkanoate synthesis regulator phasin